MDLEGIVLGEISWTKKDKYCIISLIRGILKRKIQTHRKRDQICSCQWWIMGVVEFEEGSQKVQTFNYKINK